MRDAIELVIKALVDDADAVDVREIERNGTTRIEVHVAQADMGPGHSGIRGAINAIALDGAGAQLRFARTDVDDVGVGFGDRHRTDG